MTEKPLVSVIINCYNGGKYLREAIDSVIAQTYENWELVFWDNQSTDSTREIMESYGDSRIHYFYAPEHTPLGEARNLAMNKINGLFFSFLDADDLWLCTFLERAVSVLVNSDYVGYYCNYIDLYNHTEKIHNTELISSQRTMRDIVNYYNIGMSGVVLNYQTIKENGIMFQEKYNLIEDLDFYTHVTSNGNLYYDSTPLIKYRCHAGSTTYLRATEWSREYMDYLSDMRENFIPKGLIDEKDLWRIKKVAFASKVEAVIQNDDKKGFVKLFVKSPKYIFSYWRNLLYLLIGKESFLKIRYRRNFVNR